MVKLRKFVAYRRLERPYTRKSKYKSKSYVKSCPNLVVVRFDMGNAKKQYQYTLNLRSKTALQIRHNAIEAARQTSNRLLEKSIGPNAYSMKIKIYPHHVLRENPLASGAGADRMSMGMSLAFGKPISVAAQVREGQTMFQLNVDKPHLQVARQALQRASYKLPCSCTIEVVVNKK